MRKPSNASNEKALNAFTLLELTVVTLVLACLLMLTLPVVARSGQSSKTVQCYNNHSQLVRAWIMYSDDHAGRLAPNAANDFQQSGSSAWVTGSLNWDFFPLPPNPANTDLKPLSGSLLAPYCNRATAIYKCPEDAMPSVKGQRVRSVSMNAQIAGATMNLATLNQYGGNLNYLLFQKRYEINRPGPAQTWVFIDEHADSINDGFFPVDMSSSVWKAVPASYHGGRGMLSFADGHVETKLWQDPAIANLPVRHVFATPTTSAITNDLQWLQARTTALPQ